MTVSVMINEETYKPICLTCAGVEAAVEVLDIQS
jgi:hypothetical protein